MSAATDIQALRAELASVKEELELKFSSANFGASIRALCTELEQATQELAQLKATLDAYFEGLPQEQFVAWRKAKCTVASGETETPSDVTVGRNLPQAPTRTVANNIGGSLPL